MRNSDKLVMNQIILNYLVKDYGMELPFTTERLENILLVKHQFGEFVMDYESLKRDILIYKKYANFEI